MGNQTLGAAAVGGMFIGTLCQVFIVPRSSLSLNTYRKSLSLCRSKMRKQTSGKGIETISWWSRRELRGRRVKITNEVRKL